MNFVKKLASQSLWYGLSTMVGRFINYLLTPLLTRVFMPEEYGAISYIYAIMAFANIAYTYGMETAFFYFRKNNDGRKVYNTSFTLILLTTIFFSAVLLLLQGPLTEAFRLPHGSSYIACMVAILFFDTMTVLPFAQLRADGLAKHFAKAKLMGIVVTVLCTLLFVKILPAWYDNSGGALSTLSQLLYAPPLTANYVFVANIIGSIFTFIILYKQWSKVRISIDKVLAGNMLRYSLPLLVAGFAGMINETLDRIILQQLAVPPSSAMYQQGIYGACYKIPMLMTIFTQTVRFAAEPLFFATAKIGDNFKLTFAAVVKYFIIAGLFVFLFVMLNMWWLRTFIGSQYHSGLHIVPILLVANLCLGIYLMQSMWYKLSGLTKYGAYISIIGALITVVLNVALVPTMGYTGAAIATLICYATMMLVSYLLSCRHYPVQYPFSEMFFYFVLTVILYVVHQALYFYNWLPLGANHALGIIMLLVFAYVVYTKEVARRIV